MKFFGLSLIDRVFIYMQIRMVKKKPENLDDVMGVFVYCYSEGNTRLAKAGFEKLVNLTGDDYPLQIYAFLSDEDVDGAIKKLESDENAVMRTTNILTLAFLYSKLGINEKVRELLDRLDDNLRKVVLQSKVFADAYSKASQN